MATMMDGNQAQGFQERQKGHLPGELGIQWEEVANGRASGRFTAEMKHMAPNGFLHAASVIALVDSACGYACVASLPEGATGFTTIELKANYLGTAKVGETVACTARLAHAGRMTQVWDAEAVNQTTGKTMALFRCTQMVLYPR
jgi:1,4-dihydroxy-2-naphthoyl-CoA hydrolase